MTVAPDNGLPSVSLTTTISKPYLIQLEQELECMKVSAWMGITVIVDNKMKIEIVKNSSFTFMFNILFWWNKRDMIFLFYRKFFSINLPIWLLKIQFIYFVW